ncbi:MAG: hypothetical protein AB8W37_05865 [Arsenophonus endosymbiont of Dermacentor nuttalli]
MHHVEERRFSHTSKELYLATLNYIDSIASERQLHINSYRMLNNKIVIFATNSSAGSFLMLGTSSGIVNILDEMPNKEAEKILKVSEK